MPRSMANRERDDAINSGREGEDLDVDDEKGREAAGEGHLVPTEQDIIGEIVRSMLGEQVGQEETDRVANVGHMRAVEDWHAAGQRIEQRRKEDAERRQEEAEAAQVEERTEELPEINMYIKELVDEYLSVQEARKEGKFSPAQEDLLRESFKKTTVRVDLNDPEDRRLYENWKFLQEAGVKFHVEGADLAETRQGRDYLADVGRKHELRRAGELKQQGTVSFDDFKEFVQNLEYDSKALTPQERQWMAGVLSSVNVDVPKDRQDEFGKVYDRLEGVLAGRKVEEPKEEEITELGDENIVVEEQPKKPALGERIRGFFRRKPKETVEEVNVAREEEERRRVEAETGVKRREQRQGATAAEEGVRMREEWAGRRKELFEKNKELGEDLERLKEAEAITFDDVKRLIEELEGVGDALSRKDRQDALFVLTYKRVQYKEGEAGELETLLGRAKKILSVEITSAERGIKKNFTDMLTKVERQPDVSVEELERLIDAAEAVKDLSDDDFDRMVECLDEGQFDTTEDSRIYRELLVRLQTLVPQFTDFEAAQAAAQQIEGDDVDDEMLEEGGAAVGGAVKQEVEGAVEVEKGRKRKRGGKAGAAARQRVEAETKAAAAEMVKTVDGLFGRLRRAGGGELPKGARGEAAIAAQQVMLRSKQLRRRLKGMIRAIDEHIETLGEVEGEGTEEGEETAEAKKAELLKAKAEEVAKRMEEKRKELAALEEAQKKIAAGELPEEEAPATEATAEAKPAAPPVEAKPAEKGPERRKQIGRRKGRGRR